jgi:hypothetical protein
MMMDEKKKGKEMMMDEKEGKGDNDGQKRRERR